MAIDSVLNDTSVLDGGLVVVGGSGLAAYRGATRSSTRPDPGKPAPPLPPPPPPVLTPTTNTPGPNGELAVTVFVFSSTIILPSMPDNP